jgi:hypothetical protein
LATTHSLSAFLLELLGNFDRMKYLRPLYRALNKRDPIARQVIEGLLHN